MSKFDDNSIGYSLPSTIRDFVFDLHQAVRAVCDVEEVNRLYEIKYREVVAKYFEKDRWPSAANVASECQSDQGFLALYHEMAMRHITNKSLKPNLMDHLNSWANYKKLFAFVLETNDSNFMITTQWIYDIMQEFAYQFQGFSQYRCTHTNEDIVNTLQANRDAWNYPETVSILQKLIRLGRTKNGTPNGTVLQQFGYFASIELARLECLTCDYTSSLDCVAHIKLSDRNEPFMKLPTCHCNLFYHIAVSQMMLKKYADALRTFSDIILYIGGLLKPGAGASLRDGMSKSLSRILEKVVSLTAILIVTTPYYRVDDQVREAVVQKFEEKMRRLSNGELAVATELFESSCPKFISAQVPSYDGTRGLRNEVLDHQVKTFTAEISQQIPFLKLRSFLNLYTSIDLGKLSRFTDMNEADLTCLLMSYKYQTSNARNLPNYNGLHYFIDGEVLRISPGNPKQDSILAQERFYQSGVRKQNEISKQLSKTFATLGL